MSAGRCWLSRFWRELRELALLSRQILGVSFEHPIKALNFLVLFGAQRHLALRAVTHPNLTHREFL
jgi:hypothetical protein